MDKKKRQDLSKSPTFVGFFVCGMMGRFGLANYYEKINLSIYSFSGIGSIRSV